MKKKTFSDAKNGFTLIEVMAVVIILSIIAAFALPRYTTTVEIARASEGVQILTALKGAQLTYRFENSGNYTDDCNNLDVVIDSPESFSAPDCLIPIDDSVDPVAEIDRNDGSYTLSILIDGTIECTPSGSTCTRLGY